MPKWWDPDDQVFVLVLVAAVISQTYTHKNVLGATADATITLLATAPSEAKPATVRQVQAPSRRTTTFWASTAAFIKTAALGVAKFVPSASRRTSKAQPVVRRSRHLPLPRPIITAPSSWRVAVDRLSRPWRRRSVNSSPVPVRGDTNFVPAPPPPQL